MSRGRGSPSTERHRTEVEALLDVYEYGRDPLPLEEYLLTESGLPGPRGNLELAAAFADALGDRVCTEEEWVWALAERLASISRDEAPANDPREFLSFCGALGAAALAASSEGLVPEALRVVRSAARDGRWRMREAAAMGLQRLLARHRLSVQAHLRDWVEAEDPLLARAAVAAVAEPALLASEADARFALDLHRRVILGLERTRAEGRDVLVQGLSYTLSVVVVALPGEGFEFMRGLAASADPTIKRVVKENLKKKRLTSHFPERVAETAALLG